MFIVGELYNRRKDIHEPFGGQQQGGICTPNRHPFVFIFTGKEGSAYGYKDGWNEEGLFLYTGEGQVGDQRLERGNRAKSSPRTAVNSDPVTYSPLQPLVETC